MTTNIWTLTSPEDALFALSIVASLMISKVASGYIGAKLIGFGSRVSFVMGILTTAQMSTTLATASLGFQYGVFGGDVVAALVVLSVVSIVLAPLIARWTLGIESEKPRKFTVMWQGDNSSEEIREEEAADD